MKADECVLLEDCRNPANGFAAVDRYHFRRAFKTSKTVSSRKGSNQVSVCRNPPAVWSCSSRGAETGYSISLSAVWKAFFRRKPFALFQHLTFGRLCHVCNRIRRNWSGCRTVHRYSFRFGKIRDDISGICTLFEFASEYAEPIFFHSVDV